MSEPNGHVQESRSSVAIEQNSKGEPVVKVKVYDNFEAERLNETREAAVEQFLATLQAVGR